ncbi:MAG: hypothetical protein JJ992_10170 [Planctomycetes bacterium]|nr:hypothetical protein [Planctomycetota bacterium]
MIQDPIALAEIQQQWDGARQLRERIKANAVFGFTGAHIPVLNLSSLAYNLPFLHACAVLNDALLQLRDEGVYACRSIFLGALHNASKSAIPWNDWPLVGELIDRRNELAHKAVVISRKDCFRYIEAIENELRAWKIV